MFWLASAAVAAAVLIAISSPVARAAAADSSCGDFNKSPRQLTMHAMRTSILCLVDRARAHYGLRPLRYNRDLRVSATRHSISMVTHHYFGHEGPGGSVDRRIASVGYLGRVHAFSIGENIGGGVGQRFGSPLAVYRSWMHSPPHRRNILDPGFHDFGVGVWRGFPNGGGARAATYTVDFGSRR